MTERSTESPPSRASCPASFCSTPQPHRSEQVGARPQVRRRATVRSSWTGRIKVTEATYDKTLQGTAIPVLVDFWADWCGPCHMMAPTLDDFARRHVGSALVAKFDTDANPAIAGRYSIRGIPTLIVFDRGRERGRQVGVADLKTLETLVGV